MIKVAGAVLFFIFSLGSNFFLFSVAYNKLATPFLNESQRVENADVIMQMVLPGYALIAIASTIICFFVLKKKA